MFCQPRRVWMKFCKAVGARSMASIATFCWWSANQRLKFSGDFTWAIGEPTMATNSVEP
jgi:hypothetical protein